MLAWTKQINIEGNADSRIIIRWSQSHAMSNINKYKSKQYEPRQKNRLGTVGNRLSGGLNCLKSSVDRSAGRSLRDMPGLW